MQHVAAQLLRLAGVVRGQGGVADQRVHFADIEFDQFGRQLGGNQAALLQRVEKTAHKAVFFFFHPAEKSDQFQIDGSGNVAQHRFGIQLCQRLLL